MVCEYGARALSALATCELVSLHHRREGWMMFDLVEMTTCALCKRAYLPTLEICTSARGRDASLVDVSLQVEREQITNIGSAVVVVS